MTDSTARRSLSSRLKAGTSSISAPARSMVAGATKRFFMLVGSTQSSREASRMRTSYIESSKFRASMPEAGGGVALGVEVDDQDPEAELGQGGTEVDRGGGLAHPTLLVGHGHDPRRAALRRSGLRGRAVLCHGLGHRIGLHGSQRRRPRVTLLGLDHRRHWCCSHLHWLGLGRGSRGLIERFDDLYERNLLGPRPVPAMRGVQILCGRLGGARGRLPNRRDRWTGWGTILVLRLRVLGSDAGALRGIDRVRSNQSNGGAAGGVGVDAGSSFLRL